MERKAYERIDKIWDYISAFATNRGRVPTHAEIMAGCKIRSKSTVNYYVAKLVEEGTIKKEGKNFVICDARMIVPSRRKRT